MGSYGDGLSNGHIEIQLLQGCSSLLQVNDSHKGCKLIMLLHVTSLNLANLPPAPCGVLGATLNILGFPRMCHKQLPFGDGKPSTRKHHDFADGLCWVYHNKNPLLICLSYSINMCHSFTNSSRGISHSSRLRRHRHSPGFGWLRQKLQELNLKKAMG